MSLRKVTNRRYRVVDRQTGETVKRYVRQGDAIFAAAKLCDVWGKKRYIAEALPTR